jgi:hypothetical protein
VTTSNDAGQLIRSGFVRVDPLTNVAEILVLPSNPSTLSRALVNKPHAHAFGGGATSVVDASKNSAMSW